MLHRRNYITNTIIPEGNDEIRFGKRMYPDNLGGCIKLDNVPRDNDDKLGNAGVLGHRIGELSLNSRKHTSVIKTDSSQMKNSLSYSNNKDVIIYPSKRSLVSYASYDNQEKHFETKLVPDIHGRMSVCVGRKSGSATVHMNIDDYDLEKTYHTWKKVVEKSNPHTRSNLENDRFLTVAEDACRSDRLPVVKNRNPPVADPEGPFESVRLDLPKHARDNLDRTLTPKIDNNISEYSKRVSSSYKNTFPISQPNVYPLVEPIRGVKRNVSHWAHTDRVKKILYNYSEDESEDSTTYQYQSHRNIPEKKVSQLEARENVHNPRQEPGNIQHIEEQHHEQRYNPNRQENPNYQHNNVNNVNGATIYAGHNNGYENKIDNKCSTEPSNPRITINHNCESYNGDTINNYRNGGNNIEHNRYHEYENARKNMCIDDLNTASVHSADNVNNHHQEYHKNGRCANTVH